ncbi:kinase-like domain-containing protein [Daedaleopsis nitida]|nr:kinase-like domain-containing protein [Daedaleopsis nitida]
MSRDSLKWPYVVAVTASACLGAGALYAAQASQRRSEAVKEREKLRQIRATVSIFSDIPLPRELRTWREPQDHAFELLWKDLGGFFQERGITLYQHQIMTTLVAPPGTITSTGFMFATAARAFLETGSGTLQELLQYTFVHADILDLIARGPMSLISMNHTLPLLEVIALDDIVFGVFPKVGTSMDHAYDNWENSSAGDVLDLIVQCLEALVFLHPLGIAHRDVFKDNFLVQWIPGTLAMEHTSPSRPRVYLTDFELAIHFPDGVPDEQRVSIGPPLGGSLPAHNGRRMPPEVFSEKPYNPFKLDVWQLGTSLSDFKSTIPEIDTVLVSMTDPNPVTRPTAYEAMKALLAAIDAVPPTALKIAPQVTPYDPHEE